jgi:hypothetical protein
MLSKQTKERNRLSAESMKEIPPAMYFKNVPCEQFGSYDFTLFTGHEGL